MRICVFGASDGVGRAAAAAAAARGDQVTAFVRRPQRLHLPPAVRVVEGDALDAAAVAGAIRGQDAVLTALGGRPWRGTGVCSAGARNIVDGMQQHGVRRLVAVSSLGAGDSRQHLGWARKVTLPLVLRGALADRDGMEEIVRGSDLDWIIVRPALLTTGRPRGSWRVAVGRSIPGGFITRGDVAAFCLVQLSSDEYLRQAPTLA